MKTNDIRPIYLDRVNDRATARLLAMRTSNTGNIDVAYCNHIKITRKGGFKHFDRADLERDIRDTYEARCACEHDCCGHMFGGVSRIALKRGHLIVVTHYARNV